GTSVGCAGVDRPGGGGGASAGGAVSVGAAGTAGAVLAADGASAGAGAAAAVPPNRRTRAQAAAKIPPRAEPIQGHEAIVICRTNCFARNRESPSPVFSTIGGFGQGREAGRRGRDSRFCATWPIYPREFRGPAAGRHDERADRTLLSQDERPRQ